VGSLGNLLRERLLTEAGWQTTVLYGAQVAASGLNFLFTAVIVRAMSADDYGAFSICIFTVISFTGYLFEFGLFAAGARLLAVARDRPEERRIFGAMLAAGLAIGLLFTLFVAASGPAVDYLYPGAHVAGVLLMAAPLAAAVPLQYMVELACQGMNRIVALAALRLALPLSSLTIVVIARRYGLITTTPAVLAYLGGLTTAVVVIVLLLRPSFRELPSELRRLLKATREYGFHIYVGRVVAMMSFRLDSVLLPYFVGKRKFGSYTLARQVSEQVSNLARAMATTRFRVFANRTEVSSYIERWNLALLTAASAGLAAAGPWAIVLVFQTKHRAAIPLMLPFALMALFAGLLQPYNSFLSAHGQGLALRNLSLVMGVVNLFGLFVFARRYGAPGAAWFAVASMAFNFALHLYYYSRLRAELQSRAVVTASVGDQGDDQQ
jgi:O-antigen/teichoic acid export membrane protein